MLRDGQRRRKGIQETRQASRLEEEVLTTGAGGKGFCASGARQKMAARHSVGQKDRSLEIDRTAEHIPARAGAGGKHSPVLD